MHIVSLSNLNFTFAFLFPMGRYIFLRKKVGYGDLCPSSNMTHAGRAFIVTLSFCGLGVFCGPIMDFASSWTQGVPGGAIGAALTTLAVGVGLFTVLEDFSEIEAAYFTVVTGTTIGFGDYSPHTDAGKIACAIFAIIVINVCGGLLAPAASFLSYYCSKGEDGELSVSTHAIIEEGSIANKEKKH